MCRSCQRFRNGHRVWLIFEINPKTSPNPIGQYLAAISPIAKPNESIYSPGPSGAILVSISHLIASVRPDPSADMESGTVWVLHYPGREHRRPNKRTRNSVALAVPHNAGDCPN